MDNGNVSGWYKAPNKILCLSVFQCKSTISYNNQCESSRWPINLEVFTRIHCSKFLFQIPSIKLCFLLFLYIKALVKKPCDFRLTQCRYSSCFFLTCSVVIEEFSDFSANNFVIASEIKNSLCQLLGSFMRGI